MGRSAIANLNIEFGKHNVIKHVRNNKYFNYNVLNLPYTAIRVYRQIEDASMVWTLQNVENIDELALLCGHASILLGDYNEAEKYFLQSSEPVQALYLRRDLMQWEQALSLAQKLKPDEIPFIAREYAQQLEFT